MAARTSLADLIATVRSLVGSPSTDAVSDITIQRALDMFRFDFLDEPLDAAPRYVAGQVVYESHYAPLKLDNFEDDATFLGPSLQAVTPTTSDFANGLWTFSAASFPPSGLIQVYITGKSFDVFAAAVYIADVLLAKMALEGSATDFKSPQGSYSPSQQYAQLERRRDELKTQVRLGSVPARRSDILPGGR